jgi:putative transposase
MELDHPLAAVCRILDAPRSTVYHRRTRGDGPRRLGPRTELGDEALLELIRQVLADSPFCGEGYRKVRARLRRTHHLHVGGKRVLRLMRQAGLLAPQRARRRRTPRPHDGTIIPAGANQRWGADATMAWTRDDG